MSGWTGVDFSTLDPDADRAACRERRRPHGARKHHPRRSRPALDGAARSPNTSRIGGIGPRGRRLAHDRRRRARRLDRRDRPRRLQPRLRGAARDLRQTSSTCWCRSCSGADATRRRYAPGHACARSSSATRGCSPRIRPSRIAGSCKGSGEPGRRSQAPRGGSRGSQLWPIRHWNGGGAPLTA